MADRVRSLAILSERARKAVRAMDPELDEACKVLLAAMPTVDPDQAVTPQMLDRLFAIPHDAPWRVEARAALAVVTDRAVRRHLALVKPA